MTVTAHSTLASELQVSISATLTEVPGIQGFDLDPGENVTFEKGDLAADYDEIQSTGVQSGGSISGSGMWDPLDTVQQFLHARFNDGAEVTGNVVMGATGVEYACTFIVKKWKVKGERKNGFTFDYEFALTDRITLNESDPA